MVQLRADLQNGCCRHSECKSVSHSPHLFKKKKKKWVSFCFVFCLFVLGECKSAFKKVILGKKRMYHCYSF